jgi:hypothetical protein
MSQPSLIASIAAGCLTLACTGIATADDKPFDGGKPFLCALSELAECDAGNGCKPATAESIDAPPFLRVNVGAKKLTGTRPGGEQVETKILDQNTDGGQLILQGVENARGWSVAIDQMSGHMTVSVAGRSLAFVAFGHCTLP